VQVMISRYKYESYPCTFSTTPNIIYATPFSIEYHDRRIRKDGPTFSKYATIAQSTFRNSLRLSKLYTNIYYHTPNKQCVFSDKNKSEEDIDDIYL